MWVAASWWARIDIQQRHRHNTSSDVSVSAISSFPCSPEKQVTYARVRADWISVAAS